MWRKAVLSTQMSANSRLFLFSTLRIQFCCSNSFFSSFPFWILKAYIPLVCLLVNFALVTQISIYEWKLSVVVLSCIWEIVSYITYIIRTYMYAWLGRFLPPLLLRQVSHFYSSRRFSSCRITFVVKASEIEHKLKDFGTRETQKVCDLVNQPS